MRALPAGAPRARAERPARLDDLRREEMLRNDEEVGHAHAVSVVPHYHQARIVGRPEPLPLGGILPVHDLDAEPTLLRLQLIFLPAGAAFEIRDLPVSRELTDLLRPAIRAEQRA